MTIVHIALERMVQSFAIVKNVGHADGAIVLLTKVWQEIGATTPPIKVGHVIGATTPATTPPIKVGHVIGATGITNFLHAIGNSILFQEKMLCAASTCLIAP